MHLVRMHVWMFFLDVLTHFSPLVLDASDLLYIFVNMFLLMVVPSDCLMVWKWSSVFNYLVFQ